MSKSATTFLILLFPIALVAQVQFNGSNLMEAQLGNLPQLEPKDQYSFYDQLNLTLRYKRFSVQSRIEGYYPSFNDSKYFRFSQVRAQYNSKILDVTVGNQFISLGRGILLRTYDIPSSIWETRGYRTRYGFYRDLLGANVKLKLKKFELMLLHGEVLDVALPPTIDDISERRPDLVDALEASVRLGKQTVATRYMLHTREDLLDQNSKVYDHYVSLSYDGLIANNFSVYGELAKKPESDIDLFSDDDSYAGYLGVNYAALNFGISAEYKNYHNFSLGAGINDPPTLVKEHSYKTLNRSTHVPNLNDESGYQVEVYYSTPSGGLLTFNTSLAKNMISEGNNPVFNEYFAEYQFYYKEQVFAKLYSDYAQDPLVNEKYRYALGANIDLNHKKTTSTFELEWQQINRENITSSLFSNWYAAYTLAKASKFSGTVLLEVSADPILLQENKTRNFFPATSFSYRPNNKNIFTLFVGKRRGGPACNSGVCYDVLDFEGIELRIHSRF